MPRLEAGLADGRRLLVAGDAEDRDFRAEDRRIGDAEIGGAVLHLRQHRGGNAQDVEQFFVPLVVGDVVHQRARGVGRVGDEALAAGQPPDQEGVDRAEAELALGGARARALHIGQHPGQLGAGEIGIEQQAGLLGEELFQTLSLQLVAIACRAAVLPDDGVVDRLAGLAVPDDDGLALVGDADGRDVLGRDAGLLDAPC